MSEGDSHDLKFSQQQKSEVKFGWIRGVLVTCLHYFLFFIFYTFKLSSLGYCIKNENSLRGHP